VRPAPSRRATALTPEAIVAAGIAAFNARDLDAMLRRLDADVAFPRCG
jgi:hypothetical protein